MQTVVDPARIRAAWEGRISGCLLGKPLEVMSYQSGPEGLADYLGAAGAMPLRNYVPAVEDTSVATRWLACCRQHITRFEPDDDINYTILSLLLLEEYGADFDVADVARAWLNRLPAGKTWTAERAAYGCLVERMDAEFVNGGDAGFDLADCADNEFNEWIGAQIRADLYGWVNPGQPERAAELAMRDGSLSHVGEGLNGAAFVAALGAAIPAARTLDAAIDVALGSIPSSSDAAGAVQFGRDAARRGESARCIHEEYGSLPPVHTVNNLAIVTWALSSAEGDFSRAIGDCVTAGLDTDSNAATVGGLAGLAGFPVADHWIDPWKGRIGSDLAGHGEFSLVELVSRTVAIARDIAAPRAA